MIVTKNILATSDDARKELTAPAQRQLAIGDDRLATQLIVAAARQFAAQTRHHADEILTALESMRKSVETPETQHERTDHEG
jgi:hypothetical protein